MPVIPCWCLQAKKQGGGGEGQLLESVLKEELRFEAEESAKAHGGAGATARLDKQNPRASSDEATVDASRHFSYYAYEGGRGESLWQHTSDAFHKDLDSSSDELRPQEDYRCVHAGLNRAGASLHHLRLLADTLTAMWPTKHAL
jgi:hypothetical protein